MEITKEINTGICVFRIEGEVSSYNSSVLREAFADALAEGRGKVIVELSGLNSIDSSGMAIIIDFFVKLKTKGGTLRLCSLNEKVRRVFKFTKLNTLFSFHDSLDQALNSF